MRAGRGGGGERISDSRHRPRDSVGAGRLRLAAIGGTQQARLRTGFRCQPHMRAPSGGATVAHGNWIPAAEYFALLAFGPARSDWRLSKAIADYHADYGLQWVARAEAIANNAAYACKVRARMSRLRKRRLPLETAAVRRRVVGDLLRELPNREREIREGAEALEGAKEKALSEILTGETEVCVSDVTAGPMRPLRPVNASFFMQGMTLDVEGRLVPQPQLNPDERRVLYSRAKADNLGHVWLRTTELQSPQTGRGACTIPADTRGPTADAIIEPPPARRAIRRLDYATRDRLLVDKMHELISSGNATGVTDAARAVFGQAEGRGKDPSKVKRLSGRYTEIYGAVGVVSTSGHD
jgi:hypothetical protein